MSYSFNKIMITTDGSENTKNSVESGIELARQTGATVYAAYVVSTDFYSSIAMDIGWETMYESLKKEGRNALQLVVNAGKEAEVPVESILLEGHPVSEIVNFAEKEEMDLVILGTHGRTGFDKLLLGSVAGNVVKHCKVPVMVVRSDTKSED